MAQRQIASDFKNLQKEPVEGFLCVPDESNFFVWTIYIEGPKDTPFQGGIFELRMEFPKDYPMSPPTLRFVSEFYHPNVYKDGKVCISILHPPGHDAMSGELPEERWLPTQTVSTIILSVLSILGDPNLSSPANVDASVCWRDNRKKFIQLAEKLVEKANARVPQDIKIPHPESNAAERDAVIQKRKQEMNRNDLFDNDDPDDGLELCSDFPDDDDDLVVPEDDTPETVTKKPSKKSHSSKDKESSDKKVAKPKSSSSHGERKKKVTTEAKEIKKERSPSSSDKRGTTEKASKKPTDKKAKDNNKNTEKKQSSEKQKRSTADKVTDKKPSEKKDPEKRSKKSSKSEKPSSEKASLDTHAKAKKASG